MARCQICGRNTRSGRNVSHSNKRTPRKFRVNLQKTTITVGGLKIKMKLCTRCLKKLKAKSEGQIKNKIGKK